MGTSLSAQVRCACWPRCDLWGTLRPRRLHHGRRQGGARTQAERARYRQLQATSPSAAGLRGAERLFNWALSLNGNCSHCHSNLGATYLRLQQPAQAEAALRKQLALLPTDSDAYFSLGSALRAQKRTEEALKAFDSAVAIAPNDFESHVGRSACYSALSQPLDQIAACKAALAIRPDESQLWMEVGHAYMTRTLNDVVAAENSYLKAVDVAPTHAAPHLALGRLLAQRSRLEEAVGHFRAAHSSDKEAFGEAKLAMAVGTARAQQGRLGEANANYAAALRLNPADAKLAASIAGMEATAKTVEAYASRVQNAVDALCGTPCQDIVDASGVKSCAETWTERCAAVQLSEGFDAQSTVAVCSNPAPLPVLPAWAALQVSRGCMRPCIDESPPDMLVAEEQRAGRFTSRDLCGFGSRAAAVTAPGDTACRVAWMCTCCLVVHSFCTCDFCFEESMMYVRIPTVVQL